MYVSFGSPLLKQKLLLNQPAGGQTELGGVRIGLVGRGGRGVWLGADSNETEEKAGFLFTTPLAKDKQLGP